MFELENVSPLVKSLRLHIAILKIGGFWVPDEKNAKITANIRSLIVYWLIIVPAPVLTIFHYSVMDVKLADVAITSYMLTELVCIIFKIGIVLKRKQKVKECILMLNTSDTFLMTENNAYVKDACVTSAKMCKVYLIGCLCACGGWLASAGLGNDKHLPLNIWLPFGLSEYRYSFPLSYLYGIISAQTDGILNSSIDSLLGSLMKHATGQIQVLKENILNLHKNSNGEDEFDDEKVYGRICDCSKHYQQIYEFVETIQNTLGLVPFTQFLYSAIVICIIAYNMLTLGAYEFEMYAIINFLCCMLAELLLYCWFGEELDYESKTLNTTIYFSNWYEFGPKSKKAILTFMERAKRPMTVQAGGLFPLSLASFMMVLRRSYSLLAVLRETIK